jgi:hypothetical protein
MAYYKKEEVVNYINTACVKIQENKHTPVTDPKQALQELTDEQDLVGFFWLEVNESSENGIGIKMEGKLFVRLDPEFYTDDRFAVDSYHAAKEGISVTEIITRRNQEQKNAASKLTPEMLEGLKGFISNNQK